MVDAHVTRFLPVVSVSPFPTVVTRSINPNGSQIFQNGSLDSIQGVLQAGLIPILHGDVVLDKQQRCTILGGDHIIYWYVLLFAVVDVLFDVDTL